MEKVYDYAIAGGGIVGLSTALHLQQSGKNVLVLEKEKTPGQHQSGRNSGVIHSGIYYQPNSFKSNLCIRGRELLIDFLNEQNIPHRIEGKIVVDHNVDKILNLLSRSEALNMSGVKVLEKNDIQKIEPYCKFDNALFVPQAGVVDYKVVTEAIADKFVSLGGDIHFFENLKTIETHKGLKHLSTNRKNYEASFFINCAGLFSDVVALQDNLEPELKIIPFRGEYYVIDESKSHLVNNMIYPISNPDLPFLGIHLTKTVDNHVEAGPNAVLALAKEGYKWTNINLKEFAGTAGYKGMWKLGKKYFKTGISEMYRSLNKRVFLKEILEYIPNIEMNDLKPRVSGVRAQAVSSSGDLVDDFVFQEGEQSLHVLNSPSPAATASFAIGEHIAKKVI
jgi:L-2-hydroxyglutarate oxidase